VDPFAVGDLQFATIERLAERFIDFLVLVPSGTDANRNQERLRKSDHSILDTFLGHSEWWSRWEDRSRSGIGISFGTFVVEEFGRSMERLRYRYDGPGEEVVVRDGGRVLYHLSLYSRNPLGQKFWSQAARYSNDQLGLDFD
jgi:hypothetical protein